VFFTDGRIATLEKNLYPARDQIFAWLKAEYPATFQNLTDPTQITSLNIFLDPVDTAVNPNNAANLDASGFLKTPSQGLSIDGKSCILIGEGGDDKLRGGKGNDILIGGAGDDTYYYRIGDGHDWIADSDNTGKIIIERQNGQAIETIKLSNVFTQGQSVWKDAKGSVQITHNSPWKVTLDDDGTIELGETLADGDFGIHLIDIPNAPVTDNTIQGDLKPVDVDPVQEGIQTGTDQWGNLLVNPQLPDPGRSDALYDTTANDRIEGGGGTTLSRCVRVATTGYWGRKATITLTPAMPQEIS
jgi:Ca2+-binding RTX toxin-like protein